MFTDQGQDIPAGKGITLLQGEIRNTVFFISHSMLANLKEKKITLAQFSSYLSQWGFI